MSDLPEQLPKDISRKEGRHFHLACPECPSASIDGATESCYQAFAAALVAERAKEEMVCLDCGYLITANEEFIQDFFFLRDDGSRNRNNDDLEHGQGPASLLSALLKSKPVKPTPFARFSSQTVRRFQQAGLGNGRGSRGFRGAREFYQTSIPRPVRNLGESAVNRFTQGKQASHIQSVANAPGKVRNPQNIIWESARANMKRGSRNMTRMEIVGAKAANVADTTKIVGAAAARNAGKGAVWTVLFEFPVSLAENGICVFRGKKTGQEAAKDTGKDLAAAGAAGGVMAAGATVAVAMGAGAAMAAAAPVLAPIGVGIFAVSAGSRIWRAWKDDLALVELNFHKNCPDGENEASCYASYADWVSTYPVEELLDEANLQKLLDVEPEAPTQG